MSLTMLERKRSRSALTLKYINTVRKLIASDRHVMCEEVTEKPLNISRIRESRIHIEQNVIKLIYAINDYKSIFPLRMIYIWIYVTFGIKMFRV